jgi:hypothetical protein
MTRRRSVCAAGVVAVMLAAPRAPGARAEDAPPETATPDTAAAKQIGRSIFVVNDVDGQQGDTPPQRITVNDDVVFQEDITTGADAKAVIEFRDGSTFEIGPDAAIRVDSFIFNPEESTSRKAVEVTRGVFRYISAYASSDQLTQIKTPSGQMGIRGSVAEGVVDPAVPDFIFVGEGSATFINAAGSSNLQAGGSIAVPSATTAPMAPQAMPPAVAVETLQAIEKRLPPGEALHNRPVADDAWLKRAGEADLVPATEQQRIATAAEGTARPLPSARGSGTLAGELRLLAEASRVNLFNGRQTARTPEQTSFLGRLVREHPTAAATLRGFTNRARVLRTAATTAGTVLVMHTVGLATRSVEVMHRVAAATVRANRQAAATVRQHLGAFEHRVGAAVGNRNAVPHRTTGFEHRPAGAERSREPARHVRPPAERHIERISPPRRQSPPRRNEQDRKKKDEQR